MTTATIPVPGLKVAVVLPADQLPRDGVTPEGQPQPDILIDLAMPGGSLTVRAKVNGKNYRKMLKQVDQVGGDGLVIVLQGKLIPPPAPGGPFVLDGAGFQVTVKTPKPATPE